MVVVITAVFVVDLMAMALAMAQLQLTAVPTPLTTVLSQVQLEV